MYYASDNAGPAHPKVMQALMRANEGYALPYGKDDAAARVAGRLREIFEAPDAAVHLVATGTAANSLALACMCRPWETVFCADLAHAEEDECGAPEFFTGGAKLTLVETAEGKITPESLEVALARRPRGSVHGVQPGPLTLTNLTERGTLYTPGEVAALAAMAHAGGSAVHLDGARIANALVAAGCSPAEMTWKAGVDAVSFGGTKNGLLGVEAVILFDPDLSWEFELRRKRGAHLFSKHRFLSAQMEAYLHEGLWLEMAAAANAAAAELAHALRRVPGVALLHEPAGNMIHAQWPRAAHRRLTEAGARYYPAGPLEGDGAAPLAARLVCDWSSRAADREAFIALLAG
ncbi:threonine aldolase family protein [Profundibacterium mesophilum]|uniref:Threonine aldolase n=1 Tax=Profundibacterium mesophilum KAUST100406-0324 TaxID=1037889 RepID=A0A921NQZ5_9RHOB|nr:beta-eliminating lyase-related protein [Profundibacterium mesophilum]KAF0675782.1 Threonine aldolase [Profundibacterium mesophilum KAUST100406-0324]